MGMTKKIRCCNRKYLSVPDHRNRNRKKYWKKPECRKESRGTNKQRCLQKPENKNYFKSPINTRRVRKFPKSYSWIDHRLVSDRHIELYSHAAGIFNLFLVCAGDDKGVSYYGDQPLMKKERLEPQRRIHTPGFPNFTS
jgi:hypothetical protein